MNEKNQLVRFDWAAKRMLRDKANFVVIEGLLTVLLKEKITIEQMLESEGNQNRPDDKFNRVAKTPLEEWISYLKDGEIRPNTTTPGLAEAREKLQHLKMSKKERQDYDRHIDDIMTQNDGRIGELRKFACVVSSIIKTYLSPQTKPSYPDKDIPWAYCYAYPDAP